MRIIIILLLIFAVITLSIILLTNNDHERYIDNKKTKKDYRLGDIVKYNKTNKYNISTDYINKYPGTIGYEYAHLTSKQNDIDTLTEIVQKRLKFYPKKCFTIHLRLGDVLCYPNDNKKPISAIDFSNVINKLCPENQVKVLFYGNHTGICVDESNQYLDICSKNIPNLVISANQDADDDFCTMINSHNFIAGKGGLSELVVLVRKKLGRYSIIDDRISGYEKSIYLEKYEGNFAHLKVLEKLKHEKLKTKSQFNQDLFVLEHHNHKKNGFYLEIGVHDGENISNTSLLDQEYNWKGVCIDPFMSGMKNRSCQQFNVALGSTPGKTQFRLGGGLSGIDKFVTSEKDNKMWASKAKNFEKTTVNVRTPEDVFKEANMPHIIDYLSLDVEGAEMDILKSFPFDTYCIKYATIETNNNKEKEKELEEFMRKYGYKFEGHYKTDHIFSNNCNWGDNTLGN
jgi:FkbM family methyltransferase